ncbi:hypothetical protein K7640_16600 [Micromonospora sp. PLK6-60]|uniref:SCO7613 C-terminal domain-containing membrane protein n=1 Tax=Micromonospora sp. PLK6-60 TaxID=2873383 RepID=UPI001CA6DA15|nr:hypothetical protein [Micromonospora sp. PLK6-60]MBY8873456.1 hypothetical protein [Micromonospora sp. PLK6-60]
MENTGYPCPRCGAPADLVVGCARCGLAPYPAAAEVIRLDREIAVLGPEVERARQAYQGLAGRLAAARHRRAELAAQVRAVLPASGPVPVAGPPAAPALPGGPALPAGPALALPAGAAPAPPVGPAAGRPETSTRAVQGLLFVLGGLLLGTAAVVFTAVAWAAVGVAGRALILAAVTALVLAAPLVAARRGLRGTAETFAAVGLLLVLLDGYAAWTVDLFGVAGWPGARYAGAVAAFATVVAAGYGRLSRLVVPWYAALLTVQPVLPLLVAPARPDATGWAVVFVGVALLDLAVLVTLRRRGVGLARGEAGVAPIGGPAAGGGPVAGASPGSAAAVAGLVLAGLAYGVALTIAAGFALVPLVVGRALGSPLLAGAPLLVVALALLAGAVQVRLRAPRLIAGGLLVPVLALALLRPAVELRPGLSTVAAGVVAAGLAGAVRLLPARLRTGPRGGALAVAGAVLLPAGLVAVVAAGGAVARSLPPWHGAPATPAPGWGWQLLVLVALTVGAVAPLLPRPGRPATLVAGAALAGFAAPVAAAVPWPVVVAGDLGLGVALLLAAVTVARRPLTVGVTGAAGTALIGHGLLVGLAAPAGAGAALAVVLVAGAATAAVGRRGGGVQRLLAGGALAAALLAVPAGVLVALIGAGAAPWWQARAGFAAVAVLAGALLLVRRHWPDLTRYAVLATAAALGLAGLAPLVVPGREPLVLYAAGAALLAAVAGPTARPALRIPGLVLAGVALLAALPATLTMLATPYGAPPVPWSGAPESVPLPGALPAGLALLALAAAIGPLTRPAGPATDSGPTPVTAPDPVSTTAPAPGTGATAATVPTPVTASARGTVPALIGGGGWAAVPLLAAALPLLLAAARAPWPVLPAVTLLIGLAALLAGALPVPRVDRVAALVPVGALWTVAGLVGLLPARAGTLAGLGGLTVAAVVAGAVARTVAARLLGALLAVAAATGFAVTASLAGGLPLRTAGFAVLAVAVAVLYVAPSRGRRDALPGRALEAAAQAVALVALLLTVPAPRHAAAICVLWGAAVAVRVLRRGESAGRRRVFAGIAGGSELLGCWLLLADGGVVLLEAYTVPAAGLALAAGLVALRGRPGLTSWLALGPGLVAGLAPSLVSVLVAAEPQPWRRLLLGVAALAAVLGGAVRRWQAPALLGGATLALLALHELGRGWDLLPRWIYLAVGGLALIGLAATYERRRRDLVRLRSAVGRMS